MSNAQLAECVARLNVSLQDIKILLEEGNCPQSSSEKLGALFEAHEYVKFLELAEGFSHCMAFIDHDLFVSKLAASWNLLHDSIVIERKMVSKRLRVLEADKNSDPELILKLNNSKFNIEKRKASAAINCARVGYMAKMPLDLFLKDVNYSVQPKAYFKSLKK